MGLKGGGVNIHITYPCYFGMHKLTFYNPTIYVFICCQFNLCCSKFLKRTLILIHQFFSLVMLTLKVLFNKSRVKLLRQISMLFIYYHSHLRSADRVPFIYTKSMSVILPNKIIFAFWLQSVEIGQEPML